MVIAVYPGTFDPLTRGHEDLVRRAAAVVHRRPAAEAGDTAQRRFGEALHAHDEFAIGVAGDERRVREVLRADVAHAVVYHRDLAVVAQVGVLVQAWHARRQERRDRHARLRELRAQFKREQELMRESGRQSPESSR